MPELRIEEPCDTHTFAKYVHRLIGAALSLHGTDNVLALQTADPEIYLTVPAVADDGVSDGTYQLFTLRVYGHPT